MVSGVCLNTSLFSYCHRELRFSFLVSLVVCQVRALRDSSFTERSSDISKEITRQGSDNIIGPNHLIRPSPSSDHLVAQPTGSQMLQQLTRF